MIRRFSVALPGRAPGDELVLTAMVRDVKLQYGDSVEIEVLGRFPAVWRGNPYITNLENVPNVTRLRPRERFEIGKMQETGERIHYIRAYHRQFERMTGMPVPCRFSKPDLHLSGRERATPLVDGRYWVVVPGGKSDITVKIWSHDRWQQVINRLRPWGLRFVQEGSKKPGCIHPPMEGVLNLVGETSIRDMMINIFHAEGVICGTSLPMHIAGALGKPCVVIGGGREEPWWEGYTNRFGAFGEHADPVRVEHRFLHTLSQLSCCEKKGCWKRRVIPIDDPRTRAKYNKSLCHLPVMEGTQILPRCMQMIEVDHVVEAVMSYYEDGTLPPP